MTQDQPFPPRRLSMLEMLVGPEQAEALASAPCGQAEAAPDQPATPPPPSRQSPKGRIYAGKLSARLLPILLASPEQWFSADGLRRALNEPDLRGQSLHSALKRLAANGLAERRDLPSRGHNKPRTAWRAAAAPVGGNSSPPPVDKPPVAG